MPVVGITGGISTGKSSFCSCLRVILPEAEFFDADAAARRLVSEDDEVKRLLRIEFGPAVYSADGDLNRAALRSIVFSDEAKKHALEQILHPRIRHQWTTAAVSGRNSGRFFFADIPLLYETAGENLCDCVVVIACSPQIQLSRLMARTQLDEPTARRMIDAQMPLTEKTSRADHVIWNNGPAAELERQARLLVSVWQK